MSKATHRNHHFHLGAALAACVLSNVGCATEQATAQPSDDALATAAPVVKLQPGPYPFPT